MGWRGDVQSRVLGSDFSLPIVPVQIPETKYFKLSFNEYYSVPGVLYTSAIRTGVIEHLLCTKHCSGTRNTSENFSFLDPDPRSRSKSLFTGQETIIKRLAHVTWLSGRS